MRFVFKHNRVFFGSAVDYGVDLYRAGVYFVGLVQIFKLARLFEFFDCNRSDVHKTAVFVGSVFIKLFEKRVI